jgi:MFS family permease
MANPISARAWAILAAISLGRLAFGYQIQTVASIAPELSRVFGLDYTALGALIGLYLAPGAVAALPAGVLGRRFGDRATVGAGLCLMAAGGAICASGGAWGVGAGRVVCGLGAVALIVMQGKILAEWFAEGAFMAAVSLAIGAYPIGVGLGQLTHAPLARDLGWQAAFLAGAAIAGAAAALFIASCRPAPGAPVTRGERLAWPNRRECVLVVVAGFLWTAYNSGYLGFLSYVPSLLTTRGASAGTIGIAVALATWSTVPALFAGSWLATRFGAWPVYLIATLSLAAGVAGIAVFPAPLA